MDNHQHSIVVVGGGINGLAAAWSAWLSSGEGRARVTLLEASDAVGGKARTRHLDGYLFEEGPTGYLSGEATLDRLIELAGLEALPARQEAARRYVVRGNRVRQIKSHPLAFARSGILSLGGLLRIAREPWVRRTQAAEESVWHFAQRRLGTQAADRLIAPMVLGVWAGDAKRLSLPSAFPRMAEMEREHGSLIRAMIHLQKSRKSHGGPAGPAGHLHSFAAGMQSLPLALAERAPFEVRCHAAVNELRREDPCAPWQVHVAGSDSPMAADQVILACEPHVSSKLLAPTLPEVARELADLQIPGVAVVALAYPAGTNFPVGFGALIPRDEGYRTLGVLFDSQLFAGRSPQNSVLVRCLIGGSTDLEAASLPSEELAQLAAQELGRLFRISEVPRTVACKRHTTAIPQYELGHAQRLERMDQSFVRAGDRVRGLHLSGCHRAGVAFGKTAAEGWRLGKLAGEAQTGWNPPLTGTAKS